MKNNQYSTLSSMRRLLTYLKNYRFVLTLSVLFTVIVTIIQILTPVLLGTIVNHLQNSLTDAATIDRSFIIRIVAILIGLYIILAISDVIKERSLVYLAETLTRDMRKEVSTKIKKIPLSYFDGQSTGDLISRTTNDIAKIGNNIQLSVSQIFSSLLLTTGIMIMMFVISWELAIVFLLTVPLNFFAVRFITNHTRSYFADKSSRLGKNVGYVEETFKGTDLNKAFNYNEQKNSDIGQINHKL